MRGKYFNNPKANITPVRVANRRDANKLVEAAYKAFLGMGLMTLADMALKDDFEFTPDNASDFIDRMRFLFDQYSDGFINFDDITDTVHEELGIKIL